MQRCQLSGPDTQEGGGDGAWLGWVAGAAHAVASFPSFMLIAILLSCVVAFRYVNCSVGWMTSPKVDSTSNYWWTRISEMQITIGVLNIRSLQLREIHLSVDE